MNQLSIISKMGKNKKSKGWGDDFAPLKKQLDDQRNPTLSGLENAPVAMARFDRNMNYIYATNRWKTDYNLSNTDLVGKCHYEIFPELPESLKKIHQRTLGGEVLAGNEEPFFRQDGRTDYVSWISLPWRDLDLNICGIDIISEVVTEKVEARKEIHRLKSQLQELVNEKTKRLENLLKNERELNRFKTDLMAMASHELGNSIGVIISSCELMNFYQQKGKAGQTETLTKIIQESATGIRQTLENFLNDEKINTEQITVENQLTDIKELINTICKEFKPTLKKGQKLNFDQAEVPLVITDSLLLRHILQNLISNAIKFSPAKTEIKVSTRHRTGRLKISITDQGIGIKKEEIGLLSKMYFRGQNSKKYTGSGMGLYIANRFAHLLNGKISCESTPGKGSRFTVTLLDLAHEKNTGRRR